MTRIATMDVEQGGRHPLNSRSSADSKSTISTRSSHSPLHGISNIAAPKPRVKSTWTWLRECLSIAITWTKISVNRFFERDIFKAPQQHYTNPLHIKELPAATFVHLNHTLDLAIDFLTAIETKSPQQFKHQKALIDNLTHGPASDILLDLFNFWIQESQNVKVQAELIALLPRAHRAPVQRLLTQMHDSSKFKNIVSFSRHLTQPQQKMMLEKLNEFPCRHMDVLGRATQQVLQQIRRIPPLQQFVQNLCADPKQYGEKREALAPDDPSLTTTLISLFETSTDVLDAYQRASQERDPALSKRHQNAAIARLVYAMTEHPQYFESVHTLIDAMVERHNRLSLGAIHTTTTTQDGLTNILKNLLPHFPMSTIEPMIDQCCKTYAGPLRLFQNLSQRLPISEQQGMLFNLLRSESSQSLMKLILTGMKAIAIGKMPEQHFYSPKPLEHGFHIGGICQFASDILKNSTTASQLKSSILAPNNIACLRNLLAQAEPEQALIDFAKMLPEAFRENLKSVEQRYHLLPLAHVGKHLLPHLDNEELTQIVARIPLECFDVVQQKISDILNFIGDPEDNLITALQQQRDLKAKTLEQLINDGIDLFRPLMSPDQQCFRQFLKTAKIHHDKAGHIPEHRLTPLLYEQRKLLTTTSPLARYDQINQLLADMQIPQDLSLVPTFKNDTQAPDTLIHNLTSLRSAITQHRVSHELLETVKTLLPATNDASFDNNPQGENETRPAQPPLSIDIETRREILAAVFECTARGVQRSAATAQPASDKATINFLWGITRDLILATDRTITIENSNSNPVLDDNGQPSILIFMEDGSCVDSNGKILAKGDKKNLALQEQYKIHSIQQEKEALTRVRLRELVQRVWPECIRLLSQYPDDASFQQLLDKALLPTDVQRLLVNLIEQLLPRDFRESVIGHHTTRGLTSMPPELIKSIIDRVPDDLIDRFSCQVTRLINDLDPYEQMPFFTEFANKLVISLGESRSVQSVSEVLTKGYYKEICHADKRQLAKAILNLGCPETHHGEITAKSMQALVTAMTQSGGPGFQKAMQLFKGDIYVQSIREALDCMNSEVSPMADADIRNIIEQDLRLIQHHEQPPYQLVDPAHYQPLDSHWPSADTVMQTQLKRLGAATIAQTHKAYLWQCKDGQPLTDQPPVVAAIKVLRPFVAHRIRREMQSLQRIPNISSSVSQTLKELENAIVSETDFKREYDFGHLMRQLYVRGTKREKYVDVVDMLGHGGRLLIQKFSPGQSIQRHWQDKGANFTLYFGTMPEKTNSALQREPNRILVKMHHQQVTGLEVTTKHETRFYPLTPNDPLVRELLDHQRLFGQEPPFSACYALSQRICDQFKIATPDLLSLPDQADFLGLAGDRLRQLIGGFAKGLFSGSPTPATLVTQEPADRANTILLQAQPHWQLTSFDSTGDIDQEWRPTHPQSPTQVHAFDTFRRLLSDDRGQPLQGQDLEQRLGSLTTQDRSHLRTAIRALLNANMLFKGESFIDSDRHDGNLLFHNLDGKETAVPIGQLVCIDTGAGTIVTEYEREGMLKMGMGMASINVDLIMDGLHHLIPELPDLLPDHGETLRGEIEKSIKGGFIEDEKIQELHQFLLMHNLIDANETDRVVFYDLLHDPRHSELKRKAFDFNQPQQSVNAIIQYLNYQRSAANRSHLRLDQETGAAFIHHIKNMDYGRVFSANQPTRINPLHWATDGHNSLIFIKSTRKIANILEAHNIYAPELIIQLNRGTKFIEDQLKRVNIHKAQVKRKIESLDGLHSSPPIMTPKIKAALEPTNLGEAYITGALSLELVTDTFKALGWKSFNSGASFLKERLDTLVRGSEYRHPPSGASV